MLELILMRHAKSDWSDESASDEQRVLNPRGQRDAPKMGAWIAEQDLIPDLVLCSTAMRAKLTAELVVQQWGNEVPVIFSQRLYHASPETILAVISSESMEANRVMAVGHNPGMEFLAGHYSGACGHFPTAAVIVLQFDLPDWSRLSTRSEAKVLAGSRPKAL